MAGCGIDIAPAFLNVGREESRLPASHTRRKVLFLLMTILSETFFALVSSHFVAFSFLSAWHITLGLIYMVRNSVVFSCEIVLENPAYNKRFCVII